MRTNRAIRRAAQAIGSWIAAEATRRAALAVACMLPVDEFTCWASGSSVLVVMTGGGSR